MIFLQIYVCMPEADGGIRSIGTGVTNGCEPPSRF